MNKSVLNHSSLIIASFLFTLLSTNSHQTFFKEVQASACDATVRPSFLKEVPSLVWYTFETLISDSLENLKDSILNDSTYYNEIDQGQILDYTRLGYESLDTTNLELPQKLYTFRVPSRGDRFISNNYSKILQKMDEFILGPTFIENDFNNLFFSSSPVKKNYFFAYSNEFDVGFYGGCYLSATTDQALYNYEALIQESSTPNYPLVNGNLYTIEIKQSVNGSILDSYEVYVSTSLVSPSFTVNQTNLLSISVDNNITPSLTYSESVSLNYRLAVPEALIVYRNLNNPLDEGSFLHISETSENRISGTLPLPSNQRLKVSIYYLDHSNNSPLIKRTYEIYTSPSTINQGSQWFEITETTNLDNNETYNNTLFDYKKNNIDRDFTLFVNQRPNGRVKHEGVLIRALTLTRDGELLITDDYNKTITTESNHYRFIKNGSYSINYRFNNQPRAEVNQSIVFNDFSYSLKLLDEDLNTIQELTTNSSDKPINYLNSTNLFLTFDHIPNNNIASVPIDVTLISPVRGEQRVLTTNKKELNLTPLLALDLAASNRFNFIVIVRDVSTSTDSIYDIRYKKDFECFQMALSFDQTKTINDQFKPFTLVPGTTLNFNLDSSLFNRSPVCSGVTQSSSASSSESSEINLFEASAYTRSLYLLVSSDIQLIRFKHNTDSKQDNFQSLNMSTPFASIDNNSTNLRIYKIDMPDEKELSRRLTTSISIRDVYGNELNYTFTMKPLQINVSFGFLPIIILVYSLVLLIVFPLSLNMKKFLIGIKNFIHNK
jgi:hypothetical protein